MALKSKKKEELLLKLLQTFRTLGYEGATLSKISGLTGLSKASLYHHFPEGKKQMIEEVLDLIEEYNHVNIIQVLRSTDKPKKKIQAMMNTLSELHHGGASGCIIGALVYSDILQDYNYRLRDIISQWIDAIKEVLIEAGFEAKDAKKRAEDTVAMIQGALIVSKGLQKKTVFNRLVLNLANEVCT